jgi:NAD+ synthase (glutamine-hydrolysing)
MKENEHANLNFGFVRTASASPKLAVANPFFNVKEIKELLCRAHDANVQLMVFPELCITGYTCQDLFFQKTLQTQALSALQWLITETGDLPVVYIVGIPLAVRSRLFNCAVVIHAGRIHGVIPKSYLPNTREFYEKRWFSIRGEPFAENISLLGQEVPFGKTLFELKALGITLGVEICEDLWAPLPPSTAMALEGANVIVNLSASNELVSKASYRKSLVLQQSARLICAYLYAGAGVHESTTDLVFAGDCMIAENGLLLSNSRRFARESQFIIADIDIEKISFERETSSSFADSTALHQNETEYEITQVPLDSCFLDLSASFYREVDPFPFVPASLDQRQERCEEIFQIQTAGLAKRLGHTGLTTVYVGISGGLDSTLALLIAHKTFELLGLPLANIVGVTMPGFGTTSQTYDNAITLMQQLKVSITEIDIKASCLAHFKDIRHDPEILDVTYENVQARERTQILMDLANKHGGIVIGTGDLSELALGWCTYNGDQMSMYGVNSSIPKTLIRYLIDWISQTQESTAVHEVLKRILDTPISPELLPPDKDGNIAQKTESAIGPYELHDFFLYYFLRQGVSPDKAVFLAKKAFGDKYCTETIQQWLRVFYKRFFSQQFKRSCMPDGPKVGSVSLSPRGYWRMPSDADGSAWYAQIGLDDVTIL